jgi:hypothetical protein
MFGYRTLGFGSRANRGAVPDGDRAMWMGGHSGAAFTDVIQYVAVSTLGNATDFGNVGAITNFNTNCVDNGALDRGIICGGSNIIEFVTISTPGDSVDFGDLSGVFLSHGTASNQQGDRGLIAGGATS